MIRHKTLLLAASLLVSGPACAQSLPGFPAGDDKIPLQLEAGGGLAWDSDAQTYTGSGGVHIQRGALNIEADTITAHYTKDNGEPVITRAVASGEVIIRYDDLQLTTRKATIWPAESRLRADGPSRLQTSRYQLEAGQFIDYRHKSGEGVAGSPATLTDRQSGNRLTANTLQAWLKPGDEPALLRAVATDAVKIDTAKESATADNASYTASNGLARLRDNVRLLRGSSVIDTEEVTINLHTGVSVLGKTDARPAAEDSSSAQQPGANTGRVRGVLRIDDWQGMEQP